jgi:hypothetical protein
MYGEGQGLLSLQVTFSGIQWQGRSVRVRVKSLSDRCSIRGAPKEPHDDDHAQPFLKRLWGSIYTKSRKYGEYHGIYPRNTFEVDFVGGIAPDHRSLGNVQKVCRVPLGSMQGQT